MTENSAQKIELSNRISIVSGVQILPFLLVALIWGTTDVLIAKASVQSRGQFRPTDFSPLNLIKFIWSKRIWIWMVINQIGSVLYAYLLGIYPEEYSLIWANSLTVLVAFVLDKVMQKFEKQSKEKGIHNERSFWKGLLSRNEIQNCLGIGFILLGIYLMLV